MPDSEQRANLRWSSTAHMIWSIIGGLILLAAAGYAIGRIAGAIAPFLIGFVIVFLLQAPVATLESRGLKRSAATALCFAVGFIVVSVFMVFFVPIVGRQLISFADEIPALVRGGQDLVVQLQQRFSAVVVPAWVTQAFQSVAQSVARIFTDLGTKVARGLLTFGSGFATVVFDLFLAAVISFWTLRDLPTIRRELSVLAGPSFREDLDNLLSTVGRVVGGYLRGQTIASITTGTLAAIGLAIVGVPYALMLGVITGIFNYVPYVGPMLSGVIAAAIGLFASPLQGILAIAMVAAAQQVTDLFVTPRVMSEQVDLHPTLVIFSLLVGGALFGFGGMILAIPVAATAKGLFVYYWEQRTSRQLASESGALFRTSQCDDGPEQPYDDSETPGEDLPDDETRRGATT